MMGRLRTTLQGLALAALVSAGSVSPPDADAQTSFRATPHDARWTQFEGYAGCHVVHDLPGHATFLLTRRTDGRQIVSLFFRQPPRELQTGDLYITNPPWGRERRNHVEPVRLHPADRTVRFSQRTSRRIVDALREGREPLIRYESWYSNDTFELSVTPTHFRQALRRHNDCVDRQNRVDLGVATRGAVIPGATGDRLADADPDGEWEGDMPRMPRGPRTDLYFASGSAGLTRDSHQKIRRFVRDLEDNPHWGVVLSIGYTDSRGDPEINEQVARDRAEAVANELVRMGVAEDRIEVDTRVSPDMEPEMDAASEAENRRVELRTAL